MLLVAIRYGYVDETAQALPLSALPRRGRPPTITSALQMDHVPAPKVSKPQKRQLIRMSNQPAAKRANK